MFRTEFDESQLLLITEVSGFWSIETVAAYRLDVLSHVRRVKLRHPFFHILGRGGKLNVQAPEVAHALNQVAIELATLCPGRFAIVAGTMLSKMQASRSGSHERLCTFLDESQAKSWLFGMPAPSAAS